MNRLIAEAIVVVLLIVAVHGWNKARTDFTVYKAQQAQVVADAVKVQKEKDDATLDRNKTTISDLMAATRDASARGDSLAQRLSVALARRCPVPESTDRPAATPPSGESAAPDSAGILAALSQYDAACQRDAARLDALNAELAPQL